MVKVVKKPKEPLEKPKELKASAELKATLLRLSKEEKDQFGFETLKSVDDDKFLELEKIAEISDFEKP